MSYSEYKFGDFRKYYDDGPSAGLVGFATGFADSFSSSFTEARAARNKADDDLFKLAVTDIQDREKAKAKASTKGKDYRKKAAALAAMYPGIDGVEAYIYQGLVGGMTANNIATDLQSGINDNRLRVNQPDGTQVNPLEAPKAPEADADVTSSVETQTDTVLSSAQPEPNTSDILLSDVSEQSADQGLSFEPFQEAGLGSGWMDRVRARQQEQRDSRVKARVDKWKNLTGRNDPTTASGLTSTNTSKSTTVVNEVNAARTEGSAPVDAVVNAVGTLMIIPKDPKDTSKTLGERIDVTKVDDSEKVLAALAALNLEKQDDPEVIAMRTELEKLQTQLQLFPDIGIMNENQLNEFVKTANDDPKYKNVAPSILKNMVTRANAYMVDIKNTSLPALTFGTAEEGRGIQADLEGKGVEFSDIYRSALSSRIKALETVESAKEEADFVFNEDSLKTIAFNARKDIYANETFATPEDKKAAWELWQKTEGTALLSIYNSTKTESAPTSFAGLSVSVLMQQDSWKNATPEKQQDMIAAVKANLDGSKSSTLTRSNVSAKHAAATLGLTSTDPKVRADADAYLKTIYPVEMTSIIASEAGGNDQTYAVTTEVGLVVSATQGTNEKGEIVYTDISSGKVIPNPISVQTEELDKSKAASVRGASNLLSDQTKLMGAATNVAVMGYKLEELARQNPYVLTSAGKVNSLFVSGRNELTAMLDIIGNAAGDDTVNDTTLAGQITNYLDTAVSQGIMNAETASVYQQFMGASIQYIFAAGKALGQTGNGFSNQDYKNIRNSLLTSNNIDTFAKGLQKFASDRMLEASSAAVTLRGQTLITEAERYGAKFGNELNTAEEYFANLRKTLTNMPDIHGWAQGKVPIVVNTVNNAPTVVPVIEAPAAAPELPEGLSVFKQQTIQRTEDAIADGKFTSEEVITKLTGRGYPEAYIRQTMPFLFSDAQPEE
jgi:hypothetical protein